MAEPRKGDADIDGPYRYWLSRRVAEGDKTVLFVGLNPSYADDGPINTDRGHENVDDKPTMTKLLIFDDREGSQGVLLKLSTVLSRLPLTHVDAWLVSGLEAMGAMPFGVPMPDFQELTHRLSLGVLITPEELTVFRSDDVEIHEGQFRGLSFARSRWHALGRFHCGRSHFVRLHILGGRNG